MLISCICNQEQLESKAFQKWAVQLGEAPMHMHRKIWEWCFIVEALKERGLLAANVKGLGFAVGEEPLASLFCSMGCNITATDLFLGAAQETGWVDTGQHATGLSKLNERELCSQITLEENCEFKYVDMNKIPQNLEGYDFLWSACALEHLGSISLGEQYIYNAMKCLRPGGVAVHTTEYNFSSNTDTVEEGGTVLFRQQDIRRIVETLRAEGHEVEIDYEGGSQPFDNYIDVAPYKQNPHLKLVLAAYVITSIALIIKKKL